MNTTTWVARLSPTHHVFWESRVVSLLKTLLSLSAQTHPCVCARMNLSNTSVMAASPIKHVAQYRWRIHCNSFGFHVIALATQWRAMVSPSAFEAYTSSSTGH